MNGTLVSGRRFRVYHNARVLIGLRKCLVELQAFYLGLQDVPPFVANEPHPRYFLYEVEGGSDANEFDKPVNNRELLNSSRIAV